MDKELEGLFFIYDDIKINKNDMLELYFIKDLFNFLKIIYIPERV